ncbi:hypothetical protein ANAPH1_00584 [Anaplasma phagocytophilum]|nr:hypothetical protein ANAPH1_00584 [Anaplasma phagocytophilum]
MTDIPCLEEISSPHPASAPITSIACMYAAKYLSASSLVLADSPKISNEHSCFESLLLATASSMSRPMTKCLPRIHIAWRAAFLIMGSPIFFRRLLSTLYHRESSTSLSTRAPTHNAKVDALTNIEEELPICFFQVVPAILSLIISSMVHSSGILNKDSAKHIKATPSSLERPYSCIKASMSVEPFPKRTFSIICLARLYILTLES